MIEDETWRRARLRAFEVGMTVSDWAAGLLERGLDLPVNAVGSKPAASPTERLVDDDDWTAGLLDPEPPKAPTKLTNRSLTSRAE